MKKDVIIIGGGIVGLMCAYYLNKNGREVTVIDEGDITNCTSFGNAGLLSSFDKTPLSYPGVISNTLKLMLKNQSPAIVHPTLDSKLYKWLLNFILNANDTLMFCKGISQDDEPDLWQKSFSGDIETWIDVGQPDEKRIKKACGQADKVIIYTFKESLSKPWFKKIEGSLSRFKNLRIIHLNIEGDIELLAKRAMNIQCNMLDNELTLISDDDSVVITQDIYK